MLGMTNKSVGNWELERVTIPAGTQDRIEALLEKLERGDADRPADSPELMFAYRFREEWAQRVAEARERVQRTRAALHAAEIDLKNAESGLAVAERDLAALRHSLHSLAAGESSEAQDHGARTVLNAPSGG